MATRVILASTHQSSSNPDSLLSKISQFVKDVSLYVQDFSEFQSWLKDFEQPSNTAESHAHKQELLAVSPNCYEPTTPTITPH